MSRGFLAICELTLATAIALAVPGAANEPPAKVDPVGLKGKVMCGYQGWFRCPGDPAKRGWLHWSRDARRLAPDTLTFEMWPDLSEFPPDLLHPAPGFTHSDAKTATLFSSADAGTVSRHFGWMKQHGIDGAYVQRFLVNLRDPSFDQVLDHCRAAAKEHGRTYAVCYDLSGMRPGRLVETLAADWKRLALERKLTADSHYLRDGGKPVLFVWGFFEDRFPAATAHRIIDLFKGDGPEAATLIGGCQWHWRRARDPEWARAFRRLDVISPWNVGNVTIENGRKFAATDYWNEDLAEAKRAGARYLPVIYPGFAWTNLKGKGSERATIPRLGGEFYWRQFVAAAERKLDMAYVAMFDEVDEGTAIFKVTNDPPKEARFATYEGLPSDRYLRLTGEGRRLLRGERSDNRMPGGAK
ncbi:MAG TPA: glycoside hydrolase family 71/99-like protein [Planctomycetia bacterium]|nr:glycoside hydrolase family 71/99-like protein [Planctomycetia bacterium]